MTASLSIREFARRDGCDESLVRRAIQRGRLPIDDEGRLSPALVGTGWRAGNRHAARRCPHCGQEVPRHG